MSALNNVGERLFDGLAVGAVHLAVLVLLVALVQLAFGRVLAPRVRYALWLIVAARLVVPVPPEVPGGLVRWELPAREVSRTDAVPAVSQATPAVRRAESPVLPRPARPSPSTRRETGERAESSPSPPRSIAPPSFHAAGFTDNGPIWRWKTIVALIWGAVAVVLLGRDVLRELAFRRRLAREPRITSGPVHALLEDCRASARIRRPVELVDTRLVRSPAVLGCLRPRLLLPAHVPGSLTESELRHVFLHELAHVRRGDTLLNAALTVLGSVWWFHPLVWLALGRLRAAQESVRDWDALTTEPSRRPVEYANTLIKLLESSSVGPEPRGAIGIIKSGDDLKRRILMIASFRTPSRSARVCGTFAVFGVGWATFTSAASTDGRVDLFEPADQSLRTITVERHHEPEDWRVEIESKLAAPLSVDLDGTSATRVISWLRQTTGLNFIFHDTVLEDWGDPEIDLKAKNVSASEVLDLVGAMVDDFGYCVTNRAVVVGDDGSLPRSFDLRFYNIRPMLAGLDEDDACDAAETVVDLARMFTSDRGEWDRDVAAIDYWNGLLIVTQTGDMHDRTHAFLNRLLNRGAEAAAPEPSWKRAAQQALATSVDISANGRIGGVLDQLSERSGVSIVTDDEDLREHTVSLQLSSMPLETVLGWIGGPHGYQVAIRNGAIVLSERRNLRLEFYDLSALLSAAGDEDQQEELLDYAEDLIRHSVDVESWDQDPRCKLTYYRDLMLVRQSPAAHAAIADLLAALERAMQG